MTSPLRISLFGAGVFAGYHAAKVAAHERTVLATVYDPDPDAAQTLADRHGAAVATSAEAAIDACDAVICAAPAIYHKTVCVPALAAGRHALIEKPLADTPDSARAISAAAQHGGGEVQVGHQERIVAEAIGLHRIPERPEQIEIVRHCARSQRNTDTSIVMDMMVHDIDLLLALYGAPEWVSTEAARRIYSNHLDAVRAELGFAGGLTAYVSSSRDADPERRWRLRFASGTVDIDFAAKTLRHDTPFNLDADFGQRADVRDNLAAAFDRFVAACLDGAPPLCTLQDGLEAVLVCDAIEKDAP